MANMKPSNAMNRAYPILTGHFRSPLAAQTNNKSLDCLGEGHQAVGGCHLTLGNRAAISVTALQIFSEQGRKLRETTGSMGDQTTTPNIP